MNDVRKMGRVTIPTDTDAVSETLDLLKRWGADAIRDCDGTEFPQELKDTGAKIYATYYTTRKDNAWAKANPDETQQCYIMTPFYTAEGGALTIPLMTGISRELMKVNDHDDIARWWEVIDRTTGEPLDAAAWHYDAATESVVIDAPAAYHEYTVSFLAYLIWDPVHMYNSVINDWKDVEHQIPFDVRQPKTHAYTLRRLREYLESHPYVNVVRFTTFFHLFTLVFDELRREKYVDWYGYSASVSPYILEQFEKEVGYKFRPEFIIDQGYYNNQYRVPTKEYKDFQAFQRREVAGVAYLDGERPYLIACRGYYTRATLAAYDFFENRFHKVWGIDSGFVPMANPFNDSGCHLAVGTDPVYGILAGQGNHSISTADIDGDGCMEIVYGAAAIDHDGSLLYSKYGTLPDGRTRAKFGHGDAMHVADIDPDSPGLEIFNVYEEGERAPYGWALRDAETGDVRFGEYAEEDLGRCMIGKIDPNTRGLQVWVKDVYDVNGRTLELPTPGTNMKIYWAGDLSTQITDGADYLHGDQYGVINDLTHGVMLQPAGTATNNGTKGNPCLVADVLGDFREELLVRTADDTAIRIYTTTDLTPHKLFTLMHDAQYRCGVAWQNNCYNQPCYPSFYYAGDMDFANVLPQLNAKPTLWMAGDSIMQSYAPGDKPVTGWGEVLHTLAHGDAVCQATHRADCPFPQEMRYELPGLVIDNCAMAGRSSKTFREEGRLDDIAAHIRPGDLLVVSFGHNDANRAKAERYVPADAFGESLRPFWDAARSHGAVCIFVSPVAMREFDEAGVCHPSFAAYREAMRAFAAEVGAPFIDLGAATAAANTAFGAERCKARYMWVGAKQDNAHQQNAGACRTAQAFVQQLLQDTTPALDVLRANFK